MRFLSKAQVVIFFLTIFFTSVYAGELSPFSGQANSDNINIRSGSTIGAGIIYKAQKGESFEVVSQAYDWYKIKLPKGSPAYIRKDLVSVIENVPSFTPSAATKIAPVSQNISGQPLNNARVIKEKVNIRLFANDSSAIIGEAKKNEIISIVGVEGGWFKIVPTAACFGWIHAKFVDKESQTVPKAEKSIPALVQNSPGYTPETITLVGNISPYGKVFRRSATHKLILPDKRVFLLKGNQQTLDPLNFRKVKVTGKIISAPGEKTPLIEIQKLEVAD